MLNAKSYARKTLLFLGIILLVPNLTSAFQNEPKDFRGIKWGTNLDKLKGFVPASLPSDPSLKLKEFYTRTDDKSSMSLT